MELVRLDSGKVCVVARQPASDDVKVAFEGTMSAWFNTEKTSVCLLDTASFGEVLFMGGEVQSSRSDEGLYHEILVRPFLGAIPNRQSVLVLGGGEGCVARDLLAGQVERIVQVEYDEGMVRWARSGLSHWNMDAYMNPKVEVLCKDAWDYIERGREMFDGVVVDLFDPREADVDRFVDLLVGCVGRCRAGGAVVAYIGDAPRSDDDVGAKLLRRLSIHLGADWKVIPYRVYVPSFYGEACFVLITQTGSEPRPDHFRGQSQVVGGAPKFMDDVNWLRTVMWGADSPRICKDLSGAYVGLLMSEL